MAIRATPMYQREGQAAYKANLDNTLKLDEHFGSPLDNSKQSTWAGQTVKAPCPTCWLPYYRKPGTKPGYTPPAFKGFSRTHQDKRGNDARKIRD